MHTKKRYPPNTKVRAVDDGEKALAIDFGIIKEVAKAMGLTPGTVSRTLHGRFINPNPKVVSALNAWLVRFRKKRRAKAMMRAPARQESNLVSGSTEF